MTDFHLSVADTCFSCIHKPSKLPNKTKTFVCPVIEDWTDDFHWCRRYEEDYNKKRVREIGFLSAVTQKSKKM